jgi:small subunit ribosomal protein S4
MARYTGPVCRLCRRSGDKLFLKGMKCYTKCTLDRRPRPPGQHSHRRAKVSDRGLQLREKQKARWLYGMLEKQFRKVFEEAEKQPGVTGETLQILLERRLDNIVYRLGFADSRAQARQLVRHGHIVLNEHSSDVPSQILKAGDTVSWKENKTKSEYYKQLLENIKGKSVPGWLTLDRERMVAKVVSLPTPQDTEAKYEVKAIVEYYSR